MNEYTYTVIWPSSGWKYITTLGLLNWQRIRCFIRSHITVIVYIILRIVAVLLLWATFSLRCVPSVYRYRRRRACQCSWGCKLCIDSPSWLFFDCGAAFISDCIQSMIKQWTTWPTSWRTKDICMKQRAFCEKLYSSGDTLDVSLNN
jgi:hypothetical protein